MSKNNKDNLNFVENFFLSGFAALVSKTSAAPIERVKLLLQNQEELLKKGTLKNPYEGLINCFRRTIADEGFNSLWRGNLANCLRYFPTQALNFAFKDKIKARFVVSKQDNFRIKLGKNLASGGLAGALSLLFVYSLDFARTRLANDLKSIKKGSGDRQYHGLIDVYKKTIASDGIFGLYRGFCISCVGIIVYRGCYFGFYDTIKETLNLEDSSLGVSFCLGYGVTVISGLLSYPLDTIRRRMMMSSGEVVKYKGSLDCGSQIIKNEGCMSIMKGAGANVLRGMAGAGVLAGFDGLKTFYVSYKSGYD